jgi:hypothetical protein
MGGAWSELHRNAAATENLEEGVHKLRYDNGHVTNRHEDVRRRESHREMETLTCEPTTIATIYMLKVYSQEGGAVANCPVMLAEREA